MKQTLYRFFSTLFVCFIFISIYTHGLYAQSNATEAAYRYFVLGDLNNAYTEIQKATADHFFQVRPEPWFVKSLILTAKFERELDLRFGNPDIQQIKNSWSALQQTFDKDRNQTFRFRILVQTEKSMRLTHEYAEKLYRSEKYPAALDAYRVYAEMYDFLVEENYRNIPVQGLEFYGRLLQREGNRAEALEYFEKLISRNIQDIEIYLAAAQLHKIEQHYDKAFDLIRKGRKLNPVDYDLLAEALNLAPFIGKADTLLTDLKKDALVYHSDAKIQFVTANLLASVEQNYAAAVKHYEQAIEVSPDYYDAIFNLAVLHYNEAVAINERMIARQYTKDQMPQMQKKRNDFYKKALPLFEKAAELRPGDNSLVQIINNIQKVIAQKEE